MPAQGPEEDSSETSEDSSETSYDTYDIACEVSDFLSAYVSVLEQTLTIFDRNTAEKLIGSICAYAHLRDLVIKACVLTVASDDLEELKNLSLDRLEQIKTLVSEYQSDDPFDIRQKNICLATVTKVKDLISPD